MKSLTRYLTCAFACRVATAKVISVPISRGQGYQSDPHVNKRSFVQSDAVKPTDSSFYYTNVMIGTPPQAIALIIDSGSSDIWVPSRKLTQLSGFSDTNFGLGFYNETLSSTYRTVPNNFSAAYGDGLYVTGTYMTDSLSIGETHVNALSMAIATNGSLAENAVTNRTTTHNATGFNGLMGLGPSLTQSNTTNCLLSDNDNCTSLRECNELRVAPCLRPGLLDRLVQQNAIGTRAYSLYLDGLGTRTGNILFGGIDTAKFKPPLLCVPINLQNNFVINLTSVSASAAMYNRSDILNFEMPQSSVPIWLDSGSPVITLPDPLPEKLQEYAGAYLLPGIEAPLISCEQSKNKSAISFGLGGIGGPVISVPISELVTPISFANGSQLGTTGREICQFGIWHLPKDIYDLADQTYVVGDAFLRSAYVVYNLDDWSISLAQTRFNSTNTNIQEIKPNKTRD